MLSRIYNYFFNRSFEKMAISNESLTKFFDAVKDDKIDDAVEILKLKEIDVNSLNKNDANQTALHIAAKNGYENLVRILINDFNADINAKDIRGDTPLKVACDNYFPKIAKYLVEKNAEDSDYSKRILNENVIDEAFDAADTNNIKKIKELLDSKQVTIDDVDKSKHNRSILQAAAKNGHMELVRLLVETYDANVNWTDDIGDLAIHMAADSGYNDIAKYLADNESMNVEDVEHLWNNSKEDD